MGGFPVSPQRPQKSDIKSIPLRTLTARMTPAALILLSLTLMILHRAGTLPVERLRTAVLSRDHDVFVALMRQGREYLEDRRTVAERRA